MSPLTERMLRAYLAYQLAPVYAVVWFIRLLVVGFIVAVAVELALQLGFQF